MTEHFKEQNIVQPHAEDSAAPERTDEEAIREMTGAPDINKPLVAEDAFVEPVVASTRPIWKLPIPKLAVIGLILVPVFGGAGFFLVRKGGSQQVAVVEADTPEAESEPAEISESGRSLQAAEQEIASLKSKMALDNQAYVKQPKRAAQMTAGQSNQKDAQASSAKATTTASATPRPATIVSRAPSPPLIQSSSPSISNRVQPVQSFARDTSSDPVETDPFEKWQQLAQVGSYGSKPTDSQALQERAASASFPIEEENRLVDDSNATSAVPAAYFSSISTGVPTSRNALFTEPTSTTPENTGQTVSPPKPSVMKENESFLTEEKAGAEQLAILTEAEAKILSESSQQRLTAQPKVQAIMAGSQVAGQLTMPVILDSEGVEDRFLVVLSDAVLDSTGNVVVPAGGLLMVKVDRASENGLVQMSATQAMWEDAGQRREMILPDRVVLIRGENGNPLIAESYGDTGGQMSAMDVGQFALGALRRVGELYTRSNSRIQTGNGTTIVTESNPSPNVLAGALEGGTEAILDRIAERNEQAIARLENRPSVPYIPAETTVQIFFNQSMQLPADF